MSVLRKEPSKPDCQLTVLENADVVNLMTLQVGNKIATPKNLECNRNLDSARNRVSSTAARVVGMLFPTGRL